MNRKVVIPVFIAFALAVGVFISFDRVSTWWEYRQTESEKASILGSFQDAEIASLASPLLEPEPEKGSEEPVEVDLEIVLPNRVLLDVQFIPQGPLNAGSDHWDIHAESCEEAASLMVHNYLTDVTVTPQQAEDAIFDLVDWQKRNFGDEHDIYPKEVKTMLEDFWGHTDVEIVTINTANDLKALLAAGNPVIAPTIAKHLHNPRYYDEDYHMIAITGYTPDRFVTNDNGTTYGEDYPYPYNDLLDAIQATGGEVIVIHS